MSFVTVSAYGRFHGTQNTEYTFAMLWLKIVLSQDTDTNSFSSICNCSDKEAIVIRSCLVRTDTNRFCFRNQTNLAGMSRKGEQTSRTGIE